MQVLADGGVLWEHDCPAGYQNGSYLIRRHQVSPVTGATWRVEQAAPLTLAPSLHCDPALGGCGMHGHVIGGQWQ